ncbi:cysteine desulfurase [Patescibacteria group bacterium]|nr:cysteine desulfurase [Patescibacteria group bacterium]
MFVRKQKRRYFDHSSGTPIDPQVFRAMQPYYRDIFYNPGAIYREGVQVREVVNQARRDIANILSAQPEEIIFVDGGTEANNLAILGTVRVWQKEHPDSIPHIITTCIEHVSVLETCRNLEREGVRVDYLGVNEYGSINISELKQTISEHTVLVSIGYVNGEIGTIQNIREVTKTIRHYRKHHQSLYPYVHTDAVQAVNYVDEIGVPQLGIDLMTLSGAKIYGPKKIAVLFVKKGLSIEPILFGGGQESGLRSGTENVPAIVGMACSLNLARTYQDQEAQRLKLLQEYLIGELKKNFSVIINAEHAEKIPNIVNVTFPHLSHEEIVIRLDAVGILCSMKSACKSGEEGDSHVIQALRQGAEYTGSIRFSFGRQTQKQDIDYLLDALKTIIRGMYQTKELLI